jgi:hypothetical protein
MSKTVHRTLDGNWAECEDSFCELKYHLPNISLAEAQAIPLRVLLPLLEAFDRPNPHAYPGSHKIWTVPSGRERGEVFMHRDYDLPAVIWPDGTLEWWHRDKLHRDGGKPARIWPSGACDYYIHGTLQEQP